MARVSIFFLIPGKEFLDYRESRLTRLPDNRPIVSGILSPVAQRLLSVDRLLLYGCRGPHTRHADADAAKQRTVAYQSGRGRGNRCFCRCELITIVTPLSWPGSAKTADSVCLCSVYRKQERSLFTAALEQTSNVPTARNVGRSCSRIRRWACGLPYPASGLRLRPSVALHVCFLTGAPWRWRPGHCPPFHAPILPATSTDCPAASDWGRGKAVIPWPVRGLMAVALPRSRSPHILPRPLIVRRWRWVPSSAGNGARSGW